MNEHDFFKQMIHDRAVNDAAVKAKAEMQTKRTVSWRRPVAIAAAALAVIVGTVFLIPSARAEVFSWFRVSRPADYLTTDPSERPDVPEFDALIASPDANEDVVTIPIDRTDSDAVNSEGALKMSGFFYENCDIALGDAVFDGETFYQSIRFNGLSGLYLFPHIGDDDSLGRDMFAVPVDPYAVWGLYENGPEEKYLTGEKTLYEFPTGYIWYELPNGNRWRGEVEQYQLEPRLYEKLKTVRPGNWDGPFAEEQQDRFYETELNFLETEGGITAAAIIFRPNDFGINRFIDENGYLTVRVLYQVSVIENAGKGMRDTDLFWADLGTISINMNAEEALTKRQLKGPDEPVALDAKTVTVSKDAYDYGEEGVDDDRVSFTKHRISTEGVYFTAETDNTTIDALCIRNVRIRAILPDSWSDSEREAFAASVMFRIRINGEGDRYAWFTKYIIEKDGSVLWLQSKIDNLPLALLRDAKTVAFIPELWGYETLEIRDAHGNPIETLDPPYGETAVSAPGANGWYADETIVEFPDNTITLIVQ